MNNLYFNSKHKIHLGRASTGIYLILKHFFSDVEVLVPANICYAAVYPIIYSDNKPRFCDVDKESGNITFKIFKENVSPRVKATIIPHMYGNPVRDIKKIADYCKENEILLVEDCASAMGAVVDGVVVGSFGDYSIFSTGYSKTIDLGYGGFILSNNDLYCEKEMYSELPLINDSISGRISEFSKKYRAFRNSVNESTKKDFIVYAKSDLRDLFLHKCGTDYVTLLEHSLNELDKTIRRRVSDNDEYDKHISYSNRILRSYKYPNGSVPWRKSIFVSDKYRDSLVHYLLSNKVPVSDWYPSIAILFDDYKTYENINSMEKTILNFPLLIDKKEIQKITGFLNKFSLSGVKYDN